MHFPDGDQEVDADGKSGGASEESGEDHDRAQNLHDGRDVSEPAGKSQTGDEMREVVQAAEKLWRAMRQHHDSQYQAHDREGQRLKAVEIFQIFFSKMKNRV